ncbi:hypothetical protein D3C79_778630 [compost metagenome]
MQRLVVEPLAQVQAVDVCAGGQQLPALEQGPHHHGGLLGIEVIGVGKVAQILAHVAAGVEPAAVHIPPLLAAIEAGIAVGAIEGAAGALALEVVDHIGEAGATEQLGADGEAGGAGDRWRYIALARTGDGLQPVVAGLLEGAEIGAPEGTALPARHLACGLQRRLEQDLAIVQPDQPELTAELGMGGALQQGHLVSVTIVTHLIDQEFHQTLTPWSG